jgi:hypothetical protein
MNKISTRTSMVAIATAAATITAGGLAYAYWSTNGTGQATAAAGNALGVTAIVGTPMSSATLLYPNATGVPALVTVHNPNSFPVKVSQVVTTSSPTANVTVDPTHLAAGCTSALALVSLVGGSSGAINVSVPAGGDNTVAIPAGSFSMGLASDNACQGATFSFAGASAASPSPVTVTAAAG